mgnify:CR=1 FL=1
MDLTQSLGETRVPVLVTNVEYDVEEVGHRVDTPVLHVRSRQADGTLVETAVEGFRPYFAIRQSDFAGDSLEVCNDRRVIGAEVDCSPEIWADVVGFDPDEVTAADVEAHLSETLSADIYHTSDPYTTIHDEPVARVYTRVPGDVGGETGLRGALDCDTFEADVPFVRRFLITAEIYQAMAVNPDADRVRYENWPGESDGRDLVQELEPVDDPPAIDARMVVYDIEVATEGEGFPEPERALHPITSISAYDSYTDEYRLWGLIDDEWERDPDQLTADVRADVRDREGFPDDTEDGDAFANFELFEDETQLLESFHRWVLACDPDIFTGYNADGFDTPYLIQRSYNVQALSIKRYSETGNPGVWVEEYKGERQVNFSLGSRSTLDILEAYKKTQFRELDSYQLDDVASAELGFGKVGLDGDELDDAWHNNPVEFYAYSLRDAQATAEVEAQAGGGLLDLFENLRMVTGAPYETAVSNGPMLDTLFLRRAHEKGLILPSNTEPDEDVYHGAKVFDPVPGVHRNSVYPDLKSMYPMLFAMLNLGKETIIGTEADLAASEYTTDDCYQFPADERDFAIVEKGEPIDHVDRDKYKGVKTPQGGVREMFEPQYDWLYVLRPEVKESFVQDTVDELIDLKYNYSGQIYSAVKRVTNSVYGVAGDSASGGKGFRLYDRRVAEGITLAGRLTITYTAEAFTEYLQDNYDPEATLVGGDTDSSTTSIPNAPDMKTAWDWANEAVEYVDASYDEFAKETFDMPPEDHRLEVELESLASALFYMEGETDESYQTGEHGMLVKDDDTHGVRKRYAQSIVWDDDDGWIDTADPDDGYEQALTDPEDRSDLKYLETVSYDTFDDGPLAGLEPTDIVSITGFEYVRSDSAQITRDAQLQVLTDILLDPGPKDRIETYLNDTVDAIEAGDVPLGDLARPKGISQQLDEYGWKDVEELADEDITEKIEQQGGRWRQTPGPTYRGAKYADDWLSWEQLGAASKPLKIPIEKVRGDDYPAAYEYHSYPEDSKRPDPPEVGRPVDAIAVENPSRLPDDFVVDRDSIIEKAVRDPLEDILETMGYDWDDMLGAGSQSSLDAFT